VESTQFIPSVFGISAHSIVALQKPPHCNQSHSAAKKSLYQSGVLRVESEDEVSADADGFDLRRDVGIAPYKDRQSRRA
jgi:hypothetical protein